MASAKLSIRIAAEDAASGVMRGIGAAAQGLASAVTAPARAFGGLVNVLGKVGLAGMGLKVIAEGVAGLAQGMVAGNAEFERYEVQFGVLLGSAAMAKDRLAELTEFAAKTPFELPEVVRADKVLTAFGLDTAETAKRFGVSAAQIRTTIGDAASGAGVSFEELATTMGKFASGATGEAIARFQELGLATREQMASWGMQFSKTGQLLTPANEAFAILEKNIRAKYGGMMEAQSNTFEGMVSNLQDWLGQTKRALMAPVFEVLKGSLKELLGFLSAPGTKAILESLAKSLAVTIGGAMTTLGQFGAEALPILRTLIQVFREVSLTINDLLETGDFVGFAFGIQEALSGLGDLLRPLVEGIARQVPVALGYLGDLGNQILGWIGGQANALLAKLQTWAQAFAAWIGPAVMAFLKAWPSMLSGILDQIEAAAGPILAQLGDWAQAFAAWIGPKLPDILLALGGIVAAILIFIGETVYTLGDRLLRWAAVFVEWVTPLIPPLLVELSKLLVKIGDWLVKTAAPAIWTKAQEWGKSIISGMLAGLAGLWQALVDAISAELRKIRIDIGPFHLDANGFRIDMAGINLPAGAIASGPSGGGGAGFAAPGFAFGGAPTLGFAAAGARGGVNVNVYVAGSVTAERDLAETIRREFVLVKSRNYTTGVA